MLTETLEVKLVNPTANKQRKLRETDDEFQRALRDAFNQNCTTQTATNDVVVDYDLSGYAKNALKMTMTRAGTGPHWPGHKTAESMLKPSRRRSERMRLET